LLNRESIGRQNDHPSLIRWLNNLGGFLASRYKRTGEIKDLEEAIQTAQQRAMESTPADDPDRAVWLNNLESRYEHLEGATVTTDVESL
jgi:hypothetical protein